MYIHIRTPDRNRTGFTHQWWELISGLRITGNLNYSADAATGALTRLAL